METWDRPDPRPRLRPRALVVALVVALATGWLALGAPESVRPGDTPAADPAEVSIERSAPRADASLPQVGSPPWQPPDAGTWAVLPDAPVGSRTGHVVAALEDVDLSALGPDLSVGDGPAVRPVDYDLSESAGGGGGAVIAWGGYQHGRPLDTAAVFDITAGRWQRLANSPAVEDGHVGMSVGSMLLLLHAGTPMAYQADRGFWRRLPAPDLAEGLEVTPVSAFTGRLAVALTATVMGEPGPTVAYDVVRNTWSLLPAPPGPVSSDQALVWDGSDLLLFGRQPGATSFGHRLAFDDPSARVAGATWEPLPPPPIPDAVARTAAVRAVASGSVADGDPVYLWLGARPGAAGLPRMLAYTGEAGWQDVPSLPDLRTSVPQLFWTGEEIVVVGTSGVGAADPADGTARRLPDAEVADEQLRDAAWTGSYLVWWGGDAKDGAVWRPSRDAGASTTGATGRPDGYEPVPAACRWVPWDVCADHRLEH